MFTSGTAFDRETEIYDLSGNVWEWTQNRWGKSFNQADFDYDQWEQQGEERKDPEPMELRIARGGSWGNIPRDSRCASRDRNHPDLRDYDVGFRVVFSLAAEH